MRASSPCAPAFRSSAAVKLPKDAPPLPSTPSVRFDPDAADLAAEAADGGERPCALHTLRVRALCPDDPTSRVAAPGGADVLQEKPPEKSFIAKYGMFVALLLVNLVFRGGAAAPEAGASAPAAGGARAGGAKRD